MTTFMRFIHTKCTLRAHDEQAKKVQRGLRGDALEKRALHRPEHLAMFVSVGPRHGDMDRTDRLGLRASARTGDTGYADSVRRSESLASTARERDGHRLGHFAVFADEIRIDAREGSLRRRGVADRAAHEVRRAPGDVSDARRQQTSGTRLGSSDGLTALDQN